MNMNMNERFHTLITKSGEDISLSYDERTKMRGMIREYMAMKPLRIQSSPDASPSRMPSPVSWLYSPRFIIAALLLSIGGSSAGISSSAQSALPGDLLYPIKTRVVEPVQGALAISATQKTAWAVAITGLGTIVRSSPFSLTGSRNSATASPAPSTTPRRWIVASSIAWSASRLKGRTGAS